MAGAASYTGAACSKTGSGSGAGSVSISGAATGEATAATGGARRTNTHTKAPASSVAIATPASAMTPSVNVLTIDATDPKSGTAEFKAAAIRVEKLTAASDP